MLRHFKAHVLGVKRVNNVSVRTASYYKKVNFVHLFKLGLNYVSFYNESSLFSFMSDL